ENTARLITALLLIGGSNPQLSFRSQRSIRACFLQRSFVKGNRGIEVSLNGFFRHAGLEQFIRLLVLRQNRDGCCPDYQRHDPCPDCSSFHVYLPRRASGASGWAAPVHRQVSVRFSSGFSTRSPRPRTLRL